MLGEIFDRTHMQTIDVVVPVYRGATYLPELVTRVSALKGEFSLDAPVRVEQLFLVLDEPADDSGEVAFKLASDHDWIRVLVLSRNFGQHAATVAGINASNADWIVTLDEDLQHPPEAITSMLTLAVKSHSDIVYARSDSVHGGWRDWSSRYAKKIIVLTSGIENAHMFSSFRLMRGQIARAAGAVTGHETYLDVALRWYTVRSIVFPVRLVDERNESSYTFRGLLRHMRRLIISSDLQVLRFGAGLGAFAVVIGFGIFFSLILSLLLGFQPEIRGWLSLVFLITFFGGTLATMNWIVSEFVLNIAQKSQGRPTYFVIERSGDDQLYRWLTEERNAAAGESA